MLVKCTICEKEYNIPNKTYNLNLKRDGDRHKKEDINSQHYIFTPRVRLIG